MGTKYVLNLYMLTTTMSLPATHSNNYISSPVKRKRKDMRNKSSRVQHKRPGCKFITKSGRKQKEKKENSQSKSGRKAKRKERKFPIKEWEKEKKKKKGKKVPDQRKQKKYAERSLDRTISEQYRIVTK